MKSALNAVASPLPISIDAGLLVLRLGVGLSTLIFHGWGKLNGGRETWAKVGGSMSNLGIDFAPEFWGLMAALAETLFAALLVVGFLTRPAALLLGFTMLVAALNHLAREPGTQGAGWSGASHALEILAVCICLFLTGPGRYALSAWVRRARVEDVPSPS
jgi:putative oxidoreductase